MLEICFVKVDDIGHLMQCIPIFNEMYQDVFGVDDPAFFTIELTVLNTEVVY